MIPAQGSTGSDAGSVAAAAGMKEATPSTSPVPPPTPPRWGYGPPPVHCPSVYPSPVPSSPHMVQSSPYSPRNHYYPPVPPSSRSWVTPPSPYQRPPRVYSPHFGRPARPAAAYAAPPAPPRQYSIPPGMELALPNLRGGEQKYRVTYKCFKMRAEDVQGFLESMSAQAQHYQQHAPRPQHQPSYGHRW